MSAARKREVVEIGPQPGPQQQFLSSEADIAIFGGGAGGGKSFALLLEPLRHFNNPKFGAVMFRRNSTQVRNEGGLWDESYALYKPLGAHPREAFLEWEFPSGSRVKFAHLEHEKSVYDWQGSQIALICFDELTHFSEAQFTYMMSRNRSGSGVPGYIRATCNPDVDSWVRTFIDWWIGPDGYAIPERSGVLRWFVRENDVMTWADTREELLEKFGPDSLPTSATFIPSLLKDNKILMQKDPTYAVKLRALTRVDRLRLEGGNWDVRASAGMYFREEWFPVVDAIAAGWIRAVRFWDRAATKPNEQNKDPDWTRGLLMLSYPGNRFLVADLKSIQDSPGKVEDLILNVASHDSHGVKIMSQQDPGSAGVAEKDSFVRMLAGYDVACIPLTKDKLTRAKPVSAQAEVGNVKVLRAPWNKAFFQEVQNFSGDGTGHDDIVDCLSGAFNELCLGMSLLDAC